MALFGGPIALTVFLAIVLGVIRGGGAAAVIDNGYLIFSAFLVRIPIADISAVEEGPTPGMLVLKWGRDRSRMIGVTGCKGSPSEIRQDLVLSLKAAGARIPGVNETSA